MCLPFNPFVVSISSRQTLQHPGTLRIECEPLQGCHSLLLWNYPERERERFTELVK